MRILYLMPAPVARGPLGPGELQRREAVLRARASAAFEWRVGDTDDGPSCIESLADEERCIPGMLRAAAAAERDGYDALVIGCFADPGLAAARALLRIPVIGPAEAALDLACQTGRRYAVLTTSDEVLPLIHKVAQATGHAAQMAGIRTLAIPVLKVAADREPMLQRLRSAGSLAVSEDGAGVLVLGCMSLAFLDLAAELQERLRVPVVCPLAAAVQRAEAVLAARSRELGLGTPGQELSVL